MATYVIDLRLDETAALCGIELFFDILRPLERARVAVGS